MANNLFLECMRQYTATLQVVEQVPPQNRYRFMDNDAFVALIESGKIGEANAVYIQEILFRAHMAARTTLYRNEKWMDSLSITVERKNYYGFAASLRGLIECAADSYDCLRHVPGTFLRHFRAYRDALKGKFTQGIMDCGALEDILIHYTHAKKQPKHSSAPPSHKAKSSQQYLEQLEDQSGSVVRNLYAELCEVTHPAERTISIFFAEDPADPTGMIIAKRPDLELIAGTLRRHEAAFTNIFQISFNSALITLYALNRFDDARIRTEGVEHLDLTYIPAFREYEEGMEKV